MSKGFAFPRYACVFDMYAQRNILRGRYGLSLYIPNRMKHKQLFYHFLYYHGRIFDQIDDQLRVDRLTVLVLHNTQNRSFRKWGFCRMTIPTSPLFVRTFEPKG